MLERQKILILGILFLFASSIISAQDNLSLVVNIASQNGTIEQFLDSLQHQHDVVFIYSDIIKPQTIIKVPNGSYSIQQVLDTIFKEQSILYVSRDNLIILSPQSANNIIDKHVVVSGRVISRKDNPIPFATIYFENKSLGTIANSEGFFRFVLPMSCISDTLSISSIGYESAKILPDEYLTNNLEIRLKVSKIAIKDVVIRPENPDYLVSMSYKSRKENYSNKHVVMNAFFGKHLSRMMSIFPCQRHSSKLIKAAILTN